MFRKLSKGEELMEKLVRKETNRREWSRGIQEFSTVWSTGSNVIKR